jgi:hypothetical protein
MRHGTWVGALVIFVSLFWLGSACQHTWYAVSGATVQGTVVSKAISQGRGANHHVVYRFTAPDGKTIEARDSVQPGTYGRLQAGGPVAIEYIARFPLMNRVAGDKAPSGHHVGPRRGRGPGRGLAPPARPAGLI